MQRVEEGAGELVIWRGDSAVDLQVTDQGQEVEASGSNEPIGTH